MSHSPYVLSTQFEQPQNRRSIDPSYLEKKANVKCPNKVEKGIMSNCFHPRIWEAEDFIQSSSPKPKGIDIHEERHRELKNEVRTLLLAAKEPFKDLDLVDKIQQLGVAYHFEAEIEEILKGAYNNNILDQGDHADLHHISLCFRLLRQAGFYVSPDIFYKYKDEKGEFNKNLTSDVQGMLSLYEATFLSIHGEDILDDAKAFTTKHFRSLAINDLIPPLALQVQRALDISLRNGVERVHARHYISIYEDDEYRIETLLDFAKLDFNIVQSLHKIELLELSGWWDKITNDVRPKLPFKFRDRMAEGYVICMGINSEPQFSLGRKHLTKIWYIYTIFDDAHDLYKDVEELRPLHDAVQRWDDKDMKLVDHQKVVFQEMINLFKEIEVDMIRKRHFRGIPCLKQKMQYFAKWQFEEAKMMSFEDFPTFKKWLSISSRTVGGGTFLVAAVMNLDEHATKGMFEWIDSEPEILSTYASIIRLLDDIADFKTEKDRVSTVTCYMNEYGVSEQEAIQALQKILDSLWKDINRDLLRPTPVPRPILHIILGITRIISEYYTESGGDGYTEAKGRTKEIIASLLRDPISL